MKLVWHFAILKRSWSPSQTSQRYRRQPTAVDWIRPSSHQAQTAFYKVDTCHDRDPSNGPHTSGEICACSSLATGSPPPLRTRTGKRRTSPAGPADPRISPPGGVRGGEGPTGEGWVEIGAPVGKHRSEEIPAAPGGGRGTGWGISERQGQWTGGGIWWGRKPPCNPPENP